MKVEDFNKAAEMQSHIKALDKCIKCCEKNDIWQKNTGVLIAKWYDSEYPSTETVEIPSSLFHDVVVYLRSIAIKEKELYEDMFKNL